MCGVTFAVQCLSCELLHECTWNGSLPVGRVVRSIDGGLLLMMFITSSRDAFTRGTGSKS